MSDWLDPEDLEGAWHRLEDADKNCVLMWRAVVAQAIRDMASVDIPTALEAAVWIGTPDYRDVCELALMEPVNLEKAIRQAIQTDNPFYRKANTTRLSEAIMAWAGPPEEDQS